MRGASIVLALLLAGCVGRLEDLTPRRPAPRVPDGETRPRVCAPGARDVAGPRLLRRLTREELEASVRAVFDLDRDAWRGPRLAPDPASGDGYTNHADRLRVNEAYALQLREVGEEVGAIVAARAGCAETSCAEAFVARVGRRAYRRPLTDAERARYRELVAVAGDAAIEAVVAAMIQSPHFLYRSELGAPDGREARLDGYELATALAYTFTGAPPDDALLERAPSLTDRDTRARVARELALDDAGRPRPAFAAEVLRFARGWLGLASLDNLGKRPDRFPAWTPEVREALGREVDAFLTRVLLEERGTVAELLSSRTTTLDPVLAAYYGWGAPGLAERPEGWGAGVLALGGVLAVRATNAATSPTQRGHFVRTHVLCDPIEPPPPDLPPIPEPTDARTTRERYERLHAEDEFCQGCHRLMDPIGFGFERLDADGRLRALDNGFSIDDSGAIESLDEGGPARPFVGADELAALLAADPAAARCVGSFGATYAYGLSRADAECLASGALDAVEERPLVELFLELALTRHFERRAL
ncbi:MAG: DUF1588 domain-containing protein [Sandaracinaceae bacterium]|nr:DUF1588 domain-containing protein [Sandaracinaceae bacterium]